MNLKKLIALTVCATLTLSLLTACGSGDETPPPSGDSGEMYDGIWGVVPSRSWTATILLTLTVPTIVIALLIGWAIAMCSARQARVL